ncbi:MAG: class I adenylate-forming enzyme family protein [Burkholderiales bacterium]
MNIAQLLVRAARVFPERIALTRGAAPYASYRELAQRAASIADFFRNTLRLDSGDRIALYMQNCPEYFEVLMGIWWAGLTAVPINAKLHERELAYVLEDAGASCCFVSTHPADARLVSLGPVRTIDIASNDYRRFAKSGTEAPINWNGPDDLAWLFYTSGTTGRPKGVMLSHRNLLATILCYFADVDAIGAHDCILHGAAMSHGAGLYALPHLAAAATQIVPESGGFDPAEVFALASARQGVTLFAAPTMVKRLVDHVRIADPPLESIKTIVYGGGPMYQADILDALSVMGRRFVQIYGQGESPMTITALSKFHLADTAHPRYAARIASVGVAQSAVEVRVVDADEHQLPPGAPGEIVVRGDAVMRGYWLNPAASAAALKGGWLHTGDIGMFDNDGFLTLVDRAKDMIISGGSNIYPREIEEILQRHAGVAEVSVVGRRHPEWGEEVVAFVVKRAGADVTINMLDALCLDNIARFKRPREYRFVESLPKNNYGKILKTALRGLIEPGSSE